MKASVFALACAAALGVAGFSYADGVVRLTLAPHEVQGLVLATEAP